MAITHDHQPAEAPQRPRFAPHQRLTARQLNSIMEEELWRSRLLNRALHGHGVVFGYQLKLREIAKAPESPTKPAEPEKPSEPPSSDMPEGKEERLEREEARRREEEMRRAKEQSVQQSAPEKPEPPPQQAKSAELDLEKNCIHISCGLILDHHGREVFWPGGRLCMRDVVGGICVDEVDGKRQTREGWYLLRAHYAEQKHPSHDCGPCPDDGDQWRRQSVVFTLDWQGGTADSCHEAHEPCPPAECTTISDYVCGRTGSEAGRIPPGPDLIRACEEVGALCETRCGRWDYDPASGEPIACVRVVRVTPEECEPDFGFAPDKPKACNVRNFVYRTPLLYELARECHVDLAHVESVSWSDWFIPPWDNIIPWEKFAERVKGDDFRITFSKPVEIGTLNPASIILNAIIRDENENRFGKVRRVPLRELRPLHVDSSGRFARGVRLIFSRYFSRNEVDNPTSLDDGAQIELCIRGQMLRDECGRMLDARPLDVDPKWSGQSRPGGDFVTVFRVGPPPEEPKDDADD